MNLDKRAWHIGLWSNLALIAFATGRGLAMTGNPSRYFGEGRFTTAFSCFQLLLVAFFSWSIFKTRRTASAICSSRAGYWVWLLMAAGFIFLAADDAFQWHEHMDTFTQRLLHLPKNGFTDRVDDAIIGLYGMIGLWVLWLFRRELMEFRTMLRPMIFGFGCLALSVFCDTLSNRLDVLLWLTGSVPTAKWLDGWFSVGDGAFTLLAEGFFAVAFFCGWRRAITLPSRPNPAYRESTLPKFS